MCTKYENIEKEKDRENKKVGDRLAKLNKKKGDRELEWEVKSKGDEFFWKNNVNIVAVVRKGEMLVASKVKKSGSE